MAQEPGNSARIAARTDSQLVELAAYRGGANGIVGTRGGKGAFHIAYEQPCAIARNHDAADIA